MSHDPHAHDAHGDPAASAHAGPAEFPPVPAVRSITPAPEDYALPTPGAGLLWPVVWLLVAIVFVAVYRHETSRGPVVTSEHADH
jgi:hypothetical protein